LEWCSVSDDVATRRVDEMGVGDTPADGGCDDGSSIDVLVVYAAAARIAAGGTANLLAEIDLMIANSNEAYSNSDVQTQLHLVHAREVSSPESDLGLGSLTDPADGRADGVHLLRDAYAADQVVAVVSGGGGVANGMWTLEPDMADLAFCVSGRDSLPFIMTHEVGHNLGCCHASGDGGGCPDGGGLLFPYSNGHRFTGLSGTLWRTVMAYSPGEWSPLISNPAVLFDGKPTGVPGDTSSGADNARTINQSAPVVANWRCHDDACELLDLPPDAADCDGDEIPDLCAIAVGLGADLNDDGVLDACQCLTDADESGATDFVDLLLVLAGWGPCDGVCPGDVDFDGEVGFTDVLAVLAAWGPC
ncbi:MAG: hypothetical protein HKO59_13755, partial [Phycisphaerales bacterium]|nr:hypothetical protein [Phycisphaerales bacterium]